MNNNKIKLLGCALLSVGVSISAGVHAGEISGLEGQINDTDIAVTKKAPVITDGNKGKDSSEIAKVKADLAKLNDRLFSKPSYPIEILPSPLDTEGTTLSGALEVSLQSKSRFVPAGSVNDPVFRKDTEQRLNDFIIGASGRYDDLSYQVQYWNLRGNDNSFLKYGWVNYQPGEDSPHSFNVGYYQEPFGNSGYGYVSYFGSMAWLLSLGDSQGSGLGYTYLSNPWRIDAGFFTNYTLQQDATYSGKVARKLGYSPENTSSLRVAYATDLGQSGSIETSLSGRYGQLVTGGTETKTGSHWAVSLASNVRLGPWQLMGQYANYEYDVPSGTSDSNGNALPTSSVGFQVRGIPFMAPAEGQLFAATLAYDIPFGVGPFTTVTLFDDYSYLRIKDDYDTSLPVINAPSLFDKDGQYNLAGLVFGGSNVRMWLTWVTSKNAEFTGVGPNDGKWHSTALLTTSLYFGGKLN